MTTTLKDKAKEYAKRIEDALKRDGLATAKSVDDREFARSLTKSVTQTIKKELDELKFTDGRRLSDADKQTIIEHVTDELGYTRQGLKPNFESANNDEFTKLADAVENILKGNKK